jgi:hypothetical protein
MRQDLLAVVGTNFHYEQRVIFQIGDVPCIWFNRDEAGYLLLNFKMPTLAGRPRAQIDRNFWRVSPSVDKVICPPNGRLIEVKYPNGDQFRAEFFNADSPDGLDKRYPPRWSRGWYGKAKFPLTVVELWETAAGTNIEFGPQFSRIGNGMVTEVFMRGNSAGIRLNVTPEQLAALSSSGGFAFLTRCDSSLSLQTCREPSGERSG